MNELILYRIDLAISKRGKPISEIEIFDFTGTIDRFHRADVIVFKDSDGQTKVLKDREAL